MALRDVTHLSPRGGGGVGEQMTCSERSSRTHQDDLLDVFGRAPVKHPRGVVFLHVLVHALDLLVARDEKRVVSNQTETRDSDRGRGG